MKYITILLILLPLSNVKAAANFCAVNPIFRENCDDYDRYEKPWSGEGYTNCCFNKETYDVFMRDTDSNKPIKTR